MTATLIVKDGTLSVGSFVIAGEAIAPVRFIEDFKGDRIKQAVPSQPVLIAGWSSLPPAGTPFVAASTKKEAEKLATQKVAIANIPATKLETENGKMVLPIILKADVTGSLEAIKHELNKIEHERVAIRIIQEGVGAVNEGDVKQAQASGAIVIGFTVTTDTSARELAERAGILIESFKIIYELKERIEELVKERAPRYSSEEIMGQAKVLKVFNSSGGKVVLGARWESGSLKLKSLVKLERRGVPLGQGRITNLQVARIDTDEIKIEGEFGLQIETKVEIAGGDTIIAYRVVES
jgi:translation initiation factor IF-2